ncbi:MAG: hypothetical protein KY446_03030 [Proteobacteria bacterium]|nr:hypothetical protein [Pseudomonadota bacterium]
MGAFWLITGAAAVVLTAGCSDRGQVAAAAGEPGAPARVAARLDCPEREGDLRLASRAADGLACAYRGEDGAEVELRLAAASELPSVEGELKGLIPAAAAPPEPPSPPRAEDGDRTQVRLPGVDINAQSDRASVRMPGIRVDADGDNADVQIGGEDGESVDIRAHDRGAVIHIAEEADGGALRSTFLVRSEEPGPAGWRLAGYQARGSETGRVVLGVVRARRERQRGLMDDLEDLIERNARR